MAGSKVGAVVVVGSGVGGIQAALDLAGSGFKVYVVEKNPAVGGIMAQLDKTFPTNDCSMCILAPKMVEVARNPNIELLTLSEVTKIDGEAGNFSVTVKRNARYVDPKKCTNCGLCTASCPIRVTSDYNERLTLRGASYIPFPQAVPSVNLIDPEVCLFLQRGICRLCEKACKAEAIDFSQKDELVTLNVGAVILSAGAPVFDASDLPQYGYGRFKNVVSSIEFERILNASGPFGGHVVRLSDHNHPKKILWLQCVGSRNHKINNDYCSSVCCMYAIKESLILKEHHPDVDCSIFFMDIRAVGKGFDEYYIRAQNSGIRFVKARIASLDEDPITQNVIVAYENGETGELAEEEFDIVVLSVGFELSKTLQDFCKEMGLQLNEHRYCETPAFSPLETTRPGIFVCGTLSGPKDIPETVAEASGAAGKVAALLASERNKMVTVKEYPPEIDVTGEEPRIGVFVCHCGINIGSVVNVPSVVDAVKDLPGVVYAEDNLYTCSQDTQDKIQQTIKERNLNRVVVASCSPRTHEPLFQETIRDGGLNRHLFEMANIRDQCSWVHMHEPEAATEKSIDLVRMTIAKAALIQPLDKISLKMTSRALVIGGGVAGMTAALGFADQGYETYLVEKEKELGGFSRNIHVSLAKDNVQEFLKDLIQKVKNNKQIKLFTDATIKMIGGYIGNFITTVMHGPDKKIEDLEHGIVVVAVGAEQYSPKGYLYGEDPRVITQSELENRLFTNPNLNNVKSVVMIQCVGSRNEEHPYCSRICCSEAVKNALKLKELKPEIDITVYHKDIRTYGFREAYYRQSREAGVVFVRFKDDLPPEVKKDGDKISVVVNLLDEGVVTNSPDLVVLSAGIVSDRKKNEVLAKMLKVPLNSDGFFLEAHVKLRPIDFATEGVFLCGIAHSPKDIEESIAQASGTVSRASIYLSKDKVEAEGVVSVVKPTECVGCSICIKNCAYNAIEIIEDPELGKVAYINSALCKGCGLCAGTCPQQAIVSLHFTTEEILAQIDSVMGE